MAETVPVTVVTGFLGAGKTTLLNRLLRAPEMAETAVLINEFGEIGLDHLLVGTLDDTTVLLAAGCLCCTVRGDLSRALQELAPRVARGEIRRIVVETTGLADPAPILHTLMRDPFVAVRYRLAGVVTLVDAVHAAEQIHDHPEALRQIAMADMLVLSKTDRVAREDVAQLRARLGELNPGAFVVPSKAVTADMLLRLGPFDTDGKIRDVRNWLAAEGRGDVATGHAHHSHDVNRHDARIQSFCLTFHAPLHWQGIGTCLEMLIATRGESLLRVKGVLNLAGQDRPVVIHGVQHIFAEPVLLDAWPWDDPRTSRIVFITRDLERSVVEASLQAFESAVQG